MKQKLELRNIKFSKIYIFLALFVFVLIIARMAYLSLSSNVEGVNIQAFAQKRTTKKEVLESKRGTIYDAKGNALAQNVSSYTLIAYLSPSRTTNINNPKHVIDKEYTAEKLSGVLGLDKEQIISYLSKNAYQVELGPKAKNLSELKKDEILSLNLPGIGFVETQQRYYPYGDFGSYTIGYAKRVNGVDSNTEDEIKGEMGIELSFNDYLTGKNGYTLYQKDRNGYKIAGTNEVVLQAEDGFDVYLTIDSNIQLFVEQAISKMLEKSSADFVGIMLADAKTGAILASSSYPSFDPNKKNITSYLDKNISYSFEPGSTMKIFSYMAAMEYGVYNGSETYKSGIFKAKDGTEIGDWYRQGWGNITYDQGFALSSNTAVMNLISKYMNADMLRSYYEKLGFGSKTGIELPNETSGKLNFKYETEILNAGFGQGILTTSIQNVKALTSISNNGVLLTPYIVSKVVNKNTGEVVLENGKKEGERVASPETVNKIKELMRSVINGTNATATGYYYYMDGYDLIAKTGTAQVASENGKGYTGGVIRGLAGMFPGNDPEVIIYMAIKNPTNGVNPTKELVQDIIKNVSKYLNIYEDKLEKVSKLDEIELPSYINKDINDVKNSLNDVNVVVLGDGEKIVSQYPIMGSKINKIDKVFLLTNGKVLMPNIIGYSLKDFYTFAKMTGVKYEVVGNGYVVSQSINVGDEITSEMVLSVTCSSRQ